MASMIGVYGCGQKAVYVYAPDIDTWVIDGQITPLPEDFQVPPNVTKGKDKKREDKKASKAEKRGKMGPTDAASAETPPVEPTPVEPTPVEPTPVEPVPEQ